jgi:hypothetical protein
VIWNVSGAGSSGATRGTISTGGLYTPPASMPSPATLRVTVTSVAKSTKQATQSIESFEKVALRALEAADKISFRLFLYALVLWHTFRYFMGKH